MIDQAYITIASGKGGNGAVSGRREKFVPHGGPDGGDGGSGGNVYVRCDQSLNTLLSLRYNGRYAAGDGGNGTGGKKHGKKGEDTEVVVPPGTEVWNDDSGRQVADLTAHGQRILLAQGGRGGRGNVHFTSSTNRFPLLAEEGDSGVRLRLRLELKLLADVAIVGAPNAGKSSMLAAVSAARPKVADYPFTTLEPVLGVVEYGHDGFVMVDIPGLIEGAHAGVGLGDEFLRHVERTRVLIHVVDGSTPDPVADYLRVRTEMGLFDERLAAKPEVVAFNKCDIPGVDDAFVLCQEELTRTAVVAHGVSAAARIGLDALLRDVVEVLGVAHEQRRGSRCSAPLAEVPLESEDRGVSVLRPRPVDHRPEVRVLRAGRYEVTSRSAVRFAAMVNPANWGARVQLYEQLRRQGVIAALERAGIRPGDTYVVGKLELEWD